MWPRCARADPRKEGHEPIRLLRSIALATFVCLTIVAPAGAHAPGCRTHRCDAHAYRLWLEHHPFTGYVVEGRTSTFGYLTGDKQIRPTADGSARATEQPCIAIRNDATLDRFFEVEVLWGGRWHRARMIQCDWGPSAATGRSIDVTGPGDLLLGFSPHDYPTEAWGVARELR